jgi:hypothetical protein
VGRERDLARPPTPCPLPTRGRGKRLSSTLAALPERRALAAEAIALLQQVERPGDRGQHAKAEDVDLQDPQLLEVVLVPLDDGAVLHRGVLDRHNLVEAVAGDDEAADVLGEVAGKAAELAGEAEREPEARGVGVEADLVAHVGRAHPFLRPAPHGLGERVEHVLAEPQRLADLADRGARAVADHGGGEPGTMAAVLFVDVLDHFFAAGVLEVDVDVGRLAALGGNEALEQEIELGRVDRGHAQAEAHRRVGRGAAALAENALLTREADEVVDGQEVRRVAQLADELQLVLERGAHAVRHAFGIAHARARPGQARQRLDGGLAVADHFVRVLIGDLVEREGHARGDGRGARDGVLVACEQAGLLGRGLQVPLGVAREQKAGGVERGLGADGCEHVGQGAPVGVVIERVGRGDGRDPERGGEGGERVQPLAVAAVEPTHEREMHRGRLRRALRDLAGAPAPGRIGPVLGRQQDQLLALGVGDEVGAGERALALGRAAAAERQKLGQARVSRAVARIDGDLERRRWRGVGAAGLGPGLLALRGLIGHEARAHEQLEPRLLRRRVSAHDPGQGVAIAHPERGEAQGLGLQHHLVGVRAALEEREVGGADQLGVGGGHEAPLSISPRFREGRDDGSASSGAWAALRLSPRLRGEIERGAASVGAAGANGTRDSGGRSPRAASPAIQIASTTPPRFVPTSSLETRSTVKPRQRQ